MKPNEKDLLNNIFEKLTVVEGLLRGKKDFLTLDELAIYLCVKKEHIYSLTAAETWPLYKPGGKITYVKREDIDEWILSYPHKSAAEKREALNKRLIA